ncbi:thermonuclease family protein [uncultured Ruegeria sp.]|uniref:thermonuclease family protein n=1 Tax=uncultured Ruegeria sp. TaxID=259304 RepID=UPI0026223CE0|nr:thermonuclease family protein [uncultured Ruegeria sp.]
MTSIVAGLAVVLLFAHQQGSLQGVLDLFWLGSSNREDVIEGVAEISDGDTLKIGDVRLRIGKIDAPESDQTCTTPSGKSWRCGDVAAAKLGKLVAGRIVTCRKTDSDRYGRIVGDCSVEGQDIARWMVGAGWAMAYRRYSWRYVFDEFQAKRLKRGVWIGTMQPPWDWRASH